ncbi:hypothetical protein [Streptomyces smyrnaeus]|uniref:hypothetical protein n=1 Tax=Streptomyces smyrnaeus TaxID=1387713 RepID=UPI0036B3E903
MPDHDQQDASEASFVSPNITANAQPDRRCADCGQITLHVVTVNTLVGSKERAIGGWAMCFSCGACPHPVMGVPDA